MTNITLNINQSELISTDIINTYYNEDKLSLIVQQTITSMLSKLGTLTFPYFSDLTPEDWQKPLELDIYITDLSEGRQLNFEARQKDYATNILSYPSDLPLEILQILPTINLGELVICHEVLAKQAVDQQKSVTQHLTHLLVHGILHLLGFDHELGEDERLKMESFEIEILQQLGINNPYEI